MVEELFRVCGLNKKEILARLECFSTLGINFTVEECCYDASILMQSDLNKDQFDKNKIIIYNDFEKEIYSIGNMRIQEIAARLLKLNSRVLATAESITGGTIASMLTEIPGISANFYEGIVCYSKQSKMNRLNVKKETLETFGAISKETAIEMVKGLEKNPVDIGLSVTGLAGPDGDEGKPVGLVYIAVGSSGFIPVFERHFLGDRNTIKQAAANVALFYLIRFLKGNILLL